MLKEASGEGCKWEQWCLGERLNPTRGLEVRESVDVAHKISFLGLVWTGRDEMERVKLQTSSRGRLGDSGHSCDVGLLCNRLWHWELTLHCRRPLWGVPYALGDCQCVSLGRWTAIPSERQTPTLWSVFPGFVFLSSSQRQVRESSRNPPGLCIGVLQRNRANKISICLYDCFIFVLVQLLNHAWLFATPWTVACQASLSITISWSLFKLMSIELVYHPTISSSVVPFSSCLQSFPASGSFPMIVLYIYKTIIYV